jgi:hypothetical protein
MSIVLQGSTSGSCTLQEQAVAGTTVLTLPTVSGTVLTDTSPKAGNVIQVVSATTSTQVGPVTTTYTDTGISASITPTSSSSKVLVLVSQHIATQGGGADSGGQLRIVRDASQIFVTSASGVYIYNPTSGSELRLYLSFNYLDSPATTSSTTYKMQGRDSTYGSSLYFQENSSTTSITLMEIAA